MVAQMPHEEAVGEVTVERFCEKWIFTCLLCHIIVSGSRWGCRDRCKFNTKLGEMQNENHIFFDFVDGRENTAIASALRKGGVYEA